jgi:hypothetical protein
MTRSFDTVRTKNMKRASALLLFAAVVGCSTGCQTFSMTEEQFAKQQQGESVDPQTGAAVGYVGDVAYTGAMFGAFLAGLVH